MNDKVTSIAQARLERATAQSAGDDRVHLTPEDIEIYLGSHNPEPHHHGDEWLQQEPTSPSKPEK